MDDYQCISCGKKFIGYTIASKFCSSLCYSNYRHMQAAELRAKTKTCELCGKEFSREEGRSPSEFKSRRFCGRECAGRTRQNTIDDILKKIVVNRQTGC